MARVREARIRARKTRSLRNRIAALVAVILVVTVLVWLSYAGREPPASGLDKVILRTSMGDITIELYDDMPITTGNFKSLISKGIYDATIFHRVIKDLLIQGGDPTGTGLGDPSIPSIPDEYSARADHNRNDRGTVGMANAGPNTGTSQFFINLVNNNYLDGKHPVFGRVIDGMDVVDAIGNVEVDPQNNKPLQPVMIFEAVLVAP